MRQFYLSLLGFLLLVFVSEGQTLQTTERSPNKILSLAKPEEAGLSTERLQRLDRVVQEYIDRQWIPGAVVLIARHGKIVYYKGLGKDDMEKGNKMDKEAIFRIASQTKAITSTAVMMLYEEGHFLLDDPISQYIPEFKNPKVLDKFNTKDSTYTSVPATNEITIRQLLTHTSGIGYGVFDREQLGAIYSKARYQEVPIASADYLLKDQIRQLAKQPLLHQPGEKWTYGMNIDVLGYLVEVVSGMSLKDFLRQRLFDPLGMKDTYFYLPKEKGSRLTELYQENQSGKAVKYSAQYREPGLNISAAFPLMANGKYYAGGGGLSSTAMDYAIFLQMILNKGEYNGKRLLSRNTVEMMTMNQIGNLSLDEYKFGLGFSIATDKSSARSPASPGTFGWGGVFGTNYWADPQEDVLALILTQVYPSTHLSTLHEKFQVLVYQAITD
jgi:CubicO group peptidase (beta-lactamase class C family)